MQKTIQTTVDSINHIYEDNIALKKIVTLAVSIEKDTMHDMYTMIFSAEKNGRQKIHLYI